MCLRFIAPFLLLIFMVSSSFGQETNNPFDLQNKSTETELEEEAILPASDNPFDIQNDASSFGTIEENKSNIEVLSKESKDGNQIGLSILLLIPLALLLTIFRGVFNNFFESVYRDRKFNQFYRRMNSIWVLPHILLYAFFFISMAVFVHLVLSHYNYPTFDSPWTSIGFIALGIAGFVLIKHAMIFFLGDTFDVKNEYSRYALLFMTFNITIGVLLTPFNLLLLLGPLSIKYIVIIVSFIFLGLTLLLLILRSLSVANKLLVQHPMHFFTYLCTIEIAPLFIIAKMLT